MRSNGKIYSTTESKNNRWLTSLHKAFIPEGLIKSSQNAVNGLFKEHDIQGEIIQQSPKWAQFTIISLIGTATFAISWLAIAKTDEVVTVTGKLEPLGSVRVVQMPLGGIASEILVQDGDEVKAGQVVMRLDAETTQQRLNSLHESQRLKTLQLSLKEIELEQYLLINTEEESMITKNLELQETIVDRFNTLNKQGGASEIQYLQQKNRSLELEGKLKQVRVERLRQ